MHYSLNADSNQTLTIHLSGRLQFDDHSAFKSILNEHIQTGEHTHIILDLSELEFIDSSGIGMLLLAHESLNQDSKKIILSGAQGQVKRVIELTQIDKHFNH